MIDRIFEKANIEEAISNLLRKKNGLSVDGLKLEELSNYFELNGENLVSEIKSGVYNPYDVMGRYQLQRNGKHRFITTFATTDRLILRAIYQILYPMFDVKFKDCSFAYRKEKGLTDAISRCLDFINGGCKYVVKLDIADFFDEIDHNILISRLEKHIDDEALINLLKKYMKLKVKIVGENRRFTIKKGIAQGSSLSPLLSNIYLDYFDEFCMKNNWKVVRYGDDINVFLDSNNDVSTIIDTAEKFLKDNLKLMLNYKKTVASSVDTVKILGYYFKNMNGVYMAQKNNRKKHKVYYDWHRIEYKKIFGDYHVISDGILRKKDFTLFFENDEKFQHIPINSVNSISVYSDTYFTSEFFREISANNIPLYLYDRNRKFIGTFSSPDMAAGGDILLAQCKAYLDYEYRLSIAKSIVVATAKNIKANVVYYRKSIGNKKYKKVIEQISKIIEQITDIDNVNMLMIKEANIRNIYFSLFDIIIKNDDFVFEKRGIRPPINEINALISFGNTLLYNYFYTAIIKNKLDVRISYLHSAKKRRYNLNLDLSEMFKPLVIDRLNFKLINKRMLNKSMHFVNRDGGVFLNEEGRKVYLENFTNAMIHYKSDKSGKGNNYVKLIDEEVKKFKKAIRSNEDYNAFVI